MKPTRHPFGRTRAHRAGNPRADVLDRKRIEDELATLERTAHSLREDVMDLRISWDTYHRRIEKIQRRTDELRAELGQLRQGSVKAESAVTISDALYQLLTAWAAMSKDAGTRAGAYLVLDEMRKGLSAEQIELLIDELPDGEAVYEDAWDAAPHECRDVMEAVLYGQTHEDDVDRRCVEFLD